MVVLWYPPKSFTAFIFQTPSGTIHSGNLTKPAEIPSVVDLYCLSECDSFSTFHFVSPKLGKQPLIAVVGCCLVSWKLLVCWSPGRATMAISIVPSWIIRAPIGFGTICNDYWTTKALGSWIGRQPTKSWGWDYLAWFDSMTWYSWTFADCSDDSNKELWQILTLIRE